MNIEEAILVVKDYIKPQLVLLPLRDSIYGEVDINELLEEIDTDVTVKWYLNTCYYNDIHFNLLDESYVTRDEVKRMVDKYFFTMVNDFYTILNDKKSKE